MLAIRLNCIRRIFDKEATSVWLPKTHDVALVTQSMGQKFYHITGHAKPFLRHEILKV